MDIYGLLKYIMEEIVLPINIKKDVYPEVAEIWGISSNSIVLNMVDGREVKITASHNIKSGAIPQYYADYEERVEFEIGGKIYKVWAEATYPWQDGDTIEECLELAIRWVVNPH